MSGIAIFIICIQVLYVPALNLISRRLRIFNNGSQENIRNVNYPIVTVIIPVYNEELVIERRLNNIFDSDYPEDKLEVIVVDSGSSDHTSEIVETKFSNRLRLIKEDQRRGKAHAINLALKVCRGNIVILTDGPTLYEKSTISSLVTCFNDSLIGGVTAMYNIQNKKENRITLMEDLLWIYKNKIRIAESKVSSTSWLSGEACAFRKGLVECVEENSLADDSNVALQIISKGYRVIANADSFFMERSPTKFREYFVVKVRKALGGQQEVLRFRRLLFNRTYGLFGQIIFPHRLLVEIINPILCILSIALIVLSILEIMDTFGLVITVAIIALSVSVILVFRDITLTYAYVQIILVVALHLLLFRRVNVNWYQSKTTRY